MKTGKKFQKNTPLWHQYFLREKIIRSIRNFFYAQNFHEVETPLLVPSVIPESYLDYFETYLIDQKNSKKKMYLTASPEASIKKLIAKGLGNCFEITKSFRNKESGSLLHNFEFTILEWYRVKANYEDIMNDCEELLSYIFNQIKSYLKVISESSTERIKSDFRELNITNSNNIVYRNQIIDLSPPYERISVEEALIKYSGLSYTDLFSKKTVSKISEIFCVKKITGIARNKGYSVEKKYTWEQIFNQIFLNEIEPHLGKHGKPTIIYDYPKPLSGLSKTKKSDPRLAERFEIYIGGLEIGDCYSELTDYEEQKKRFEEETCKIENDKKTSVAVDKEFLKALKTGLPECAGMAMGIDRLVMFFSDKKSIRETLPFT